MARYAARTEVSPQKSRAEIERTLARYGADGFMYGWADQNALVAFRTKGRHVKFLLPMPDNEAFNSQGAYEQSVRQRWRALAMAIKAKLEIVESGITEFDAEFMAHIVLPDGQTIGQAMLPQIESAYEDGKMPPLLGYGGSA